MNYRPIKLIFIALILFVLMSPLSLISAAPAYQTTATPPPVLTSTRQISPVECYEVYTVQSTDTLSKLAQRFYGAAVYFTAILDATNAKSLSDSTFEPITETNRLKVTQKLCIVNNSNLPVITRTADISVSLPTLTAVMQINIPSQSPLLNQPIAPTLKIGEQVIEVPADKAALTAENLSPVEVVFDLIGPSGQSYVIPSSQKWPIILEPGRYSFNIHAATGRTEDIAVAPGSFEIRVGQLAELVIFARSVQLNLRDMTVPAPLNTATPQLIATLTQTIITATVTRLTTPPTVIITPTRPINTPPPTATPTFTAAISQPTSIPTVMPSPTLSNTATPPPTSTPTLSNTATPLPTTPNTATPQPTSTATITPTPTSQPTPTTSARPTENSTDAKEKLAPPLGQGRLYFQNFYRETANIALNNQTLSVEVEMIKMIDLSPKTYSFRVSVTKGAGQGEIDLAANHSWLVRLDPNGELGWVQVYP